MTSERGALYMAILFLCSLGMGGLLMYALRGWVNQQFSCLEIVIVTIAVLLFLSTIPFGGVPWNLLFFAIPVGLFLRARLGSRQMISAMRAQDYDACNRVLARDPENAAAQAKIGRLLEEDGRYAEALAAYTASLQADATQHDIHRRHRILQERVSLVESGQVKCPSCGTVVPRERGVCWRCGRVIDSRNAVLYRFKQTGLFGQLLLSGCVATLCITFSTCIAMIGVEPSATERWVAGLALLAALACGVGVYLAYRKVLREETPVIDLSDR